MISGRDLIREIIPPVAIAPAPIYFTYVLRFLLLRQLHKDQQLLFLHLPDKAMYLVRTDKSEE